MNVTLHAVARPFVVCLSVTLVHPTQPVEIFCNFSMPLVPRPSTNIHRKFYGDRLRGTPAPVTAVKLNARAIGVAK